MRVKHAKYDCCDPSGGTLPPLFGWLGARPRHENTLLRLWLRLLLHTPERNLNPIALSPLNLLHVWLRPVVAPATTPHALVPLAPAAAPSPALQAAWQGLSVSGALPYGGRCGGLLRGLACRKCGKLHGRLVGLPCPVDPEAPPPPVAELGSVLGSGSRGSERRRSGLGFLGFQGLGFRAPCSRGMCTWAVFRMALSPRFYARAHRAPRDVLLWSYTVCSLRRRMPA